MPRIRTLRGDLPTNEPTNSYEFRTQQVIIDSANAYLWTPQLAKEGDIGGRNLRVQVIDRGVIRDQSDLTLLLEWRHVQAGNSGQDSFNAIDAQHGIFEISYPNEMLLAGTVNCAIRLIYGDNERATVSRNFALTVETSPFDPDGLVVSNSFATIQEILELWHHLPQYFQNAVEQMDRFKGSYISETALAEAWNDPAGTQGLAKDGDYAFIGTVEVDAQMWIWDTTDKVWVQSTATPFSPESLKLMYESNEDTNAFTDALKTKLDGIPTLGQPDWDVESASQSGYIKHKPNIWQDDTTIRTTSAFDVRGALTWPAYTYTSGGSVSIGTTGLGGENKIELTTGSATFKVPTTMYTRTVDLKGPFTNNSYADRLKLTRTGNVVTVSGVYVVGVHGETVDGDQGSAEENLPVGFRPIAPVVVSYSPRYGIGVDGSLGKSIHFPSGNAKLFAPSVSGGLTAIASGCWITNDPWPA